MNTNHQTHLIIAYDSIIIFSDVSIDILARNKFSLITYLVQSIFIQSSLFSTHPHASLLRSVSLTISQQQFEMNCTGYRCNKDSSTNSAISSTNVFTRVHHRIYHPCVFVLVRLRIVVIFDQQPVVT